MNSPNNLFAQNVRKTPPLLKTFEKRTCLNPLVHVSLPHHVIVVQYRHGYASTGVSFDLGVCPG